MVQLFFVPSIQFAVYLCFCDLIISRCGPVMTCKKVCKAHEYTDIYKSYSSNDAIKSQFF